MPEFTVLVFKVAFLALLWLFIGLVALVIRGDLRVRPAASAEAAGPLERSAPPQSPAPVGATGSKRAGRRPAQRRRGKSAGVLALDSGDRAGERLGLVDQVRIGRAASCELILNDDYVSTVHACLTLGSDGSWTLRDLDSTNGTYVNSVKLTGATVVTPADTIQIGRTQMRLEH
ncbi:MAG: FHA domain-containing protein [Propionibacteriaceae bacterium]|jgi:pSer/pThr/pTyr-binding forkhead associated (FHA) protein|nr:FHA domain-containing protein [Propionibacteriaceae bacterium]